MGPEALAQVLRPLADIFRPGDFPDVLIGLDVPDDAGVWRLDDERALVFTADFFPPVVDDPYAFGAIAAANALSDLYAMGARPLMALNLVGYPDGLAPEILSTILRGGAEKVREAGAAIVGGHTTTDPEPKYGIAVVGLAHPDRLLTKGGAVAGDRFLLTKPLGTGILTTAAKREAIGDEELDTAVQSMQRLNRRSAEVVLTMRESVHAATDITGFSLIGHAHEMAHQSGVCIRFRWDDLPLLPRALDLASAGHVPGGARRNAEHYGQWTTISPDRTPAERDLLFDPQTSGGLLVAVAADAADEIAARLVDAGEPFAWVGEATDENPGTIEVE